MTMKWQLTLWCVVMLMWPGSSVPGFRPDSFSRINTVELETKTEVTAMRSTDWFGITDMHSRLRFSTESTEVTEPPPERLHPYQVQHAALPSGVVVYPLPLRGSDHEVMFNVTWDPPVGPRVQEYTLEVHSMTNTVDCRSNLCYEYNIPGNSLWSVIPAHASPVVEDCAVRPGCAYLVKLIAHPWDGHTVANVNVELDECVVGVCSCAHSPRLPTPIVTAKTVSIMGELFVNVTWTLPPPKEPLRLPPRLMKKYYVVSIGKQMVPDAHPAPWFAHTVSRKIDAKGFVVVPDTEQWQLLPITERNGRERSQASTNIVLDVKLLARVSLIDERGCIGPAGNDTAHDPVEIAKSTMKTFALWATVGGACVLMMVGVLAFSARIVKGLLNQFRPTSISVPQPLSHRPLWATSASRNGGGKSFQHFAAINNNISGLLP